MTVLPFPGVHYPHADSTAPRPPYPTALVIEDDPGTRQVLVDILITERWWAVSASHGEHGLRLARDLRFDVVLVDLALPTMSGLEVLRRLKGSPRTRDTAVFLVSAYARLVGERDAELADGLITKPFALDSLLEVLRQARARRQAASAG